MRIFQAWGMTETSPVATYSRPREREHDDAYWDDRAKQGRPLPWVELRLVGDDGGEVAWDGRPPARSRCAGRGSPRATSRTAPKTRSSPPAGCAPATSRRWTSAAYVQITDRSKDVIKSGGEWISSVELENELMSHPDVVEAAVIAKPDERWAERPLCCVVLREGAAVDAPGAGRAPARQGCQVVAARRVRVRGRDPQDERRQVRQEGAARPAGRRHARGPCAGLLTLFAALRLRERAAERGVATARADRPCCA